MIRHFTLILLLLLSHTLAKPLEKVSLQLQWLDQFQFAGYYVAKEKEFTSLDDIISSYSSKKTEGCTGIGLYMSKTIVEKHCQGKLTVKNDNNGAIFKVVLKNG